MSSLSRRLSFTAAVVVCSMSAANAASLEITSLAIDVPTYDESGATVAYLANGTFIRGRASLSTELELDCDAVADTARLSCDGRLFLGSESIAVTFDYDDTSAAAIWRADSSSTSSYSPTVWSEAARAWGMTIGGVSPMDEAESDLPYIVASRRATASVSIRPPITRIVIRYDGPTIILDGVDITAIWR